MRARTTRPGALALVAAIAASLTVGTAGSGPASAQAPGSTLDRPADPVVLTGARVTELVGTAPARIAGFAATPSGWTQVPVQVDERKDTNVSTVYDLPTTQTFYGSSINVPINVYADAGTFTGPDTDAAFDADDELAFMARDAGGPKGGLGNPAGTTGGAVEVRLEDPAAAGQVGYVYLYATDGSLDPAAGRRYVDYQFRLTSGDYKATYKRTDGPNPENSTATGSTYTAHFADRWLMDGLTLSQGNKPTTDIIDRVKYDIQALCVRNENTFNDEEGAFVVNKSGPVRAIRSYFGSNSGPNTQNTHTFYDTFVDTQTDLRVHDIPNVRAHLDFNREAFGMTLRSPQVPNGVPVDGQPDSIPAAAPTWWTMSGPQGGLAMSARYEQNATTGPTTWYEDDTTPADWQCTGDGEAVGDMGAHFNSWIGCTDPGLGCTQKLRGTYRVIAAPAGTSPAELQRRAEHFQRPLRVAVNGRPDPGGPQPTECVTAVNSAHVTAGRATQFLVWVWAAGSGQFIGLTTDTTSLRRSGSSWSLVTSC